jgi:DNA-binding HxlR family transcriptional regulator
MGNGDKSKIWTGSRYSIVFEFPAMKSGYGEFCPIAKASEVFATRWTPLVLRELMLGAHSFK